MKIEKKFQADLKRRAARADIERISPAQFELLKKVALMLFDQNEAHKSLLLMTMEKDLVGDIVN